MKITTYTGFSKRINSTKQPTGGTEVDVYLKENTSLRNPVFRLEPVNFNINYVKAFEHYYYVTDIIAISAEQCELYCNMDDMATHKTEIGNTAAYIEYCSKQENPWIPDQRMTVTNEVKSTLGVLTLFSNMTGSYVIGVIGADETASSVAQVGFAHYWAVNAEQLGKMSEKLFDRDIWEEIVNKTGDAFNTIIEVHWVPFDITGTVGFMYLGNNSTQLQGRGLKHYINSDDLIIEKEIELEWHYGDWRDLAPYTKLSIWLPFYGNISLDPGDFISNNTQATKIYIDVSLDPIGGEICYGLRYNGHVVTYRADCSVSVPVGQIRGNKASGVIEISGGALAVGGAVAATIASEGVTAPAIAAAVGGIASIGKGIMSEFSQDVSSKGGAGTFGQTNLVHDKSSYGDISYRLLSHKLSTEPGYLMNIEGHPYFGYTPKISDFGPGYIKCAGASVNMSGLEQDKATINQYLNSGFFYE